MAKDEQNDMKMKQNGKKMVPNNVGHSRKHQRKPLCACTGYSLNKLFVFLYAFLFLIVGAVLLIVGIWAEIERRHFRYLDSQLAAPIALLIIVGLFIAINAMMGMFGAVRENLTLLRLFLAFTVIAFCAQIIVGVIAFIFRENVAARGHKYFRFAMEEYTAKDDHIRRAVDHLQKEYSCCGLETYKDYSYNDEYSCNSNHSLSCSVPTSCCKEKGGEIKDDCGVGKQSMARDEVSKDIHVNGCLKIFRAWLVRHFDVLGAMTLGWAIPQIFGMLLVYFFIRRVYDMHAWYRVNAY